MKTFSGELLQVGNETVDALLTLFRKDPNTRVIVLICEEREAKIMLRSADKLEEIRERERKEAYYNYP